jgi:hypothetical protein
MNNPQELIILESFTDILQQLDIAYAIGGSVASSIYGKVRFTEDADVTVEAFDNQADKLIELLSSDYYISKEAVYQALKQQGTFNVIHLDSAFKIDVFIRKNTAFEKQFMARRISLRLSDSIKKEFAVISPEDIILLKLQWYRDGGFSSERQWNDVMGILTVQAERLDFDYLNKWAAILEINDLLEKAVSESS